MMDRSQIAVVACAVLLLGTAVFAHLYPHHKALPVKLQDRFSFKPFEYYGPQPQDFWVVPYGWQPPKFGKVRTPEQNRLYWALCAAEWRRLHKMKPPAEGVYETGCGIVAVWV